MPRGRPKLHDTPVEWSISIPTSLAAKVELMLFDPMTGKTKFGGRSALIQQLLRAYVEGMISQTALTNLSPSANMNPSSGENT